MGIEFEFFEAGCGDSILVSTDEGTNILIDGGTVKQYNKSLKKVLDKEIRKKDKDLDLVVLTHYDGDHIGGILKLLEEEKKNIKVGQKTIIKEIWFNSFYKDLVEIEGGKKTSGKQQVKLDEYIEEISFNRDLTYLSTVSLSNMKNSIFLGKKNEIKLTLLSPNEEKLLKLKEDYEQAYEDYYKKKKKTSSGNDYHLSFEVLLSEKSKIDISVANGSSIAFILEYDLKKYLFLGDAHIDVITNSLKYLNQTKKFEFVKLSHHGSIRNIDKDFLNLIESDTFVILTDGSHGHPNKATIASILHYKETKSKTINIICNYPKVERILKNFTKEKHYNVLLRRKING